MMKRGFFILIAICLLGISTGCSSRVISSPIEPYVSPDAGRVRLSRVAVIPFVIPDYLKIESGAETISIEMTNRFIAGVTSHGLFPVVQGQQVQQAIGKHYSSPRDWIFSGSIHDAVNIARDTGADGVLYGRVTRYLQGNLSPSEVEVELTLMEVSSLNTVWSIRELVQGKGGPEVFVTSTNPVVTARACSLSAVEGAVTKAAKIQHTGGPIRVSTVSPKKAAGYSLVTAGVVSLGVSGFYLSESMRYYQNYETASSEYDIARYREKTQESDLMWQVFGGISLASLGTGIYLLATDHQKMAQGPVPAGRKFVMAPVVMPRGGGVTCGFRF